MHFVAKVELFEKRWQGWVLIAPRRLPDPPRRVRRGRDGRPRAACSSAAAPSASSPRAPASGPARSASPRRGVGRLALETGAAVLPVAVHGTEHVPPRLADPPAQGQAARRARDDLPAHRAPLAARSPPRSTTRIWPNIELQWEWLGGLPPLRKAAVIGAGSWGTAMAVLLARGGLEVQLGCRTREQAEAIARGRENERYLPGVHLPEGVAVKRAADIELAGIDLICLGVPSAGLPAAVGALADRIGQRSAVLLLTKGLVGADGRAADRLRLRARPRPRDRLPRRPRARRARRRPASRRSSSAAPTPTCAPSSARSSTVPASSASEPATSSASRSPAPPRTRPRSPRPPPSRTG